MLFNPEFTRFSHKYLMWHLNRVSVWSKINRANVEVVFFSRTTPFSWKEQILLFDLDNTQNWGLLTLNLENSNSSFKNYRLQAAIIRIKAEVLIGQLHNVWSQKLLLSLWFPCLSFHTSWINGFKKEHVFLHFASE